MSAEYQHIRDMFAREEREALKSIDREAETGQTKIRGLMAKFVDNVDKMSKAKEEIHHLLSQSQTRAFLQVGRLFIRFMVLSTRSKKNCQYS